MLENPNEEHALYEMRERLSTADLITKTRKVYTFPIPSNSYLIRYLTWFDIHGREYITEESTLYNAVERDFKDGLSKVLKGSAWTTKVFRCFRASEFVYRYNEWKIIKD